MHCFQLITLRALWGTIMDARKVLLGHLAEHVHLSHESKCNTDSHKQLVQNVVANCIKSAIVAKISDLALKVRDIFRRGALRQLWLGESMVRYCCPLPLPCRLNAIECWEEVLPFRADWRMMCGYCDLFTFLYSSLASSLSFIQSSCTTMRMRCRNSMIYFLKNKHYATMACSHF